jgi:hypothetical protein
MYYYQKYRKEKANWGNILKIDSWTGKILDYVQHYCSVANFVSNYLALFVTLDSRDYGWTISR